MKTWILYYWKKICQLYNIEVNDLKFITAVDNNFAYSFQKAAKKYFLRGGARHSSEQILAELEWIQFLDSQRVKVLLPIQSKNGKCLELVEFDDKVINVVVIMSALGKQVNPTNPEEQNESYLGRNG